jgi:hypothetical protein
MRGIDNVPPFADRTWASLQAAAEKVWASSDATDQLLQLRGIHLGSMPVQISDISIEKSFRRLYVLHGTQGGTGKSLAEEGTVIGEHAGTSGNVIG